MSHNITAFWHKESFEGLIKERLPELLADRLPLAGYHFESTGAYTCRVEFVLALSEGYVEVEYTDIPQPDADGMFMLDGEPYVVEPIASTVELKQAEIEGVGDQLYDYFKARIREAPPDLAWDTSLVRSWLPIDRWVLEFFSDTFTAQKLSHTNWLDKHTHLRRVRISQGNQVFSPGHFGRTCPFETPEGPNVGKILTIARGAEIRDGKLVIVDESPEATLGLSAALIPFLEHNDPPRILMGANMMRQWLSPSAPETAPVSCPKGMSRVAASPEPALVQTGYEPDVPDFWCGRNLLTAFISWGGDTFEDGIVISESCAARLNFPYAIEPGDKISNRHGTKGVISRITPDDEMPHLADGTPVELVFSFGALHGRMNFGQIREAVMSRIARAEGETAIVPPFQAPSADQLRERLQKVGLPEDGMETLTFGPNGKKLDRPSTVGWVYWGKTVHIALDKLKVSEPIVHEEPIYHQGLGELEYYTLRNISAFETLREHFNTRASTRADVETLPGRVTAGTVEQAGPPTPMFANLKDRLSAAGIHANFDDNKLTFRFARATGNTLQLAQPVSHPWLHAQTINAVGICEDVSEYRVLADVNARAERMFANDAPESLTLQTLKQLQTRLAEYFDALLRPADMRFTARTLFSGRSVIVPDAELRADEVGIPEQMAWALFGRQVAKELGGTKEVQGKSQRATHFLDELMARSWVIVHRAPAFTPTAFVAFHPVRQSDRAIRVHPFVCELMNADFDGDQAAIFLPITAEGQREAGEQLSIAGHLKRDPNICAALAPGHDAIWGLASLSLTPEGRNELTEIGGMEIAIPEGLVTRRSLADTLKTLLKREGIDCTIEIAERLMQRGFEVAKESGTSMSPFLNRDNGSPPVPTDPDDETAWNTYAEELMEWIAAYEDFTDNNLGPHILAVKSRAFTSRLYRLACVVGSRGAISDIRGGNIVIRHGYCDGLTPDELYALCVGSREGLVRFNSELQRVAWELRDSSQSKGFTVLSRAMRAKHPGLVFARAAACGEIEPLTDIDSRLFVGLPVTASE
ncbi:hypothetical protein J4G02_14150 [Candidatus Poribacteria bacterium]|nr:hypothetical protein [Candidatus Poribacteria bacterium]